MRRLLPLVLPLVLAAPSAAAAGAAGGPVATRPLPRLFADVQLTSDTTMVPVRLHWRASAPAGIRCTEAQRPVDGGFEPRVSYCPGGGVTTLASWTAADALPAGTLNPGWRTRTVDSAGVASDWAVGPSFVVAALQESAPAVRYAGSWTPRALDVAWGGALRSAETAGARATLTFSGRSVAWVTSRGANMGQARVSIDGVAVATVDNFRRYTTVMSKQRYVAFAQSWAAPGTHTIAVEALGTAGRPRVDVDAFVVVR